MFTSILSLWLKLLWLEHSLSSFVLWTGRCYLYPLRGGYYKAVDKVRERSHSSTAWFWDWNLTVAYRRIARTSELLWHSSLRHRRADTRGALHSYTYSGRQSLRTNGYEVRVQTIDTRHSCHPCCSMSGDGDVDQLPCIFLCRTYPPSNYGPTYSFLGFSDSDTRVDYQLHQIHLMTSDERFRGLPPVPVTFRRRQYMCTRLGAIAFTVL